MEVSIPLALQLTSEFARNFCISSLVYILLRYFVLSSMKPRVLKLRTEAERSDLQRGSMRSTPRLKSPQLGRAEPSRAGLNCDDCVPVDELQSGSFNTDSLILSEINVVFFVVDFQLVCFFSFQIHFFSKKTNCSHAWFVGQITKKQVNMFGKSRTQRQTRCLAKAFVLFGTN